MDYQKPLKVKATCGSTVTFKHSEGKMPVAFFHLVTIKKGDFYSCIAFGDMALKAQDELKFGTMGNFELKKDKDGERYVCSFFATPNAEIKASEQSKRLNSKKDKELYEQHAKEMERNGFVKTEHGWKKAENCIETSRGYTPKIEFVMDKLTPEYVTDRIKKAFGDISFTKFKVPNKQFVIQYKKILDELIVEAFAR